MKPMNPINLLAFAASFSVAPVFATSELSIEDALKKGLIQVIINGKGGYTGDVITMKIKNTCNQNLNINLEAGRKLDSKDNNQQDILVTQAQDFFVSAKQQKVINVFGMCCQAHNSSPKQNSIYTIGKMADSSLIKLATFIDKNKYYTNHTAQEAVWAISDNNSLASITDGDKETVNRLRNYVSKITGRAIPAYDITYRQDNENDVLGRASKIEGVFNYTLPANGHVTVAIYDTEGRVVQTLFENISHKKGEYKLYYTFRTGKLPEGTYYARMKTDGVLQKEEKIEF